MPSTITLKQADGTTILAAYADVNVLSPAVAQLRTGEVFETPSGPFVQYADEDRIGDARIEVEWKPITPSQFALLYAAAKGLNGDELKLDTPYESNIWVAFAPGPDGLKPTRYPGSPPNEYLTAKAVFVRLV